MRALWMGLAAGLLVGCGPRVCYPGAGSGNTCLDLVWADDIVDPDGDYVYPEPLGGSRQYREPVAFLDLNELAGSIRVAENFRLDELAQASKGRYAIVQTHAVEYLQEMRDDIGPIRVTSGFRSPGYNAGVEGSATYSRHMYGDAFDLQGIDVSLDATRLACETAGASFTLMYTAHVHCDWRDEPLDAAFYGEPLGAAVSPATATDLRVLAPGLDAWLEVHEGVLEAPAIGWTEGEPHRRWIAYDAGGVVVEQRVSRAYRPPEGAARVDVIVGGDLRRSIDL